MRTERECPYHQGLTFYHNIQYFISEETPINIPINFIAIFNAWPHHIQLCSDPDNERCTSCGKIVTKYIITLTDYKILFWQTGSYLNAGWPWEGWNGKVIFVWKQKLSSKGFPLRCRPVSGSGPCSACLQTSLFSLVLFFILEIRIVKKDALVGSWGKEEGDQEGWRVKQ